MNLHVFIPFAVDLNEDAPNIKGAQENKLEIYYKVLIASAATLSKFSPGVKRSLITNESPPEWVRRELDILGCAIEMAPFDHNPGHAFHHTFHTSFYLIDAIAHLSHRHPDPCSMNIILDPDCLVTRNLADIEGKLSSSAVNALPMPFDVTDDVNGLTPLEAQSIANLSAKSEQLIHAPYRHLGGEFFAIPGALLPELFSAVQEAWDSSLSLAAQSRSAYTTEEHLLSAAAYSAGIPVVDSSNLVQRIWTTPKATNTNFATFRKAIWHLPAEKNYGFIVLHGAAIHKSSWFWKTSPWSARLLLVALFGLWPRILGGNFSNAIRRTWMSKFGKSSERRGT